MTPDRCLECGYRKAQVYSRGLCFACYQDHGIRARYPCSRIRKQEERGMENRNSRPPRPRIFASREERLAELERRAENYEAMYAEGDATLEDVAADVYQGPEEDVVRRYNRGCNPRRADSRNRRREKKYAAVLLRQRTKRNHAS